MTRRWVVHYQVTADIGYVLPVDVMSGVVVAAVLVVAAIIGAVAWSRRRSRATPFLTATPDAGYGLRGSRVSDGVRRAQGTTLAPPVPDYGTPTAVTGLRTPQAPLDLWHLAPGTVLRVRDERFVVRGTITFTEGGDTWVEHLLEADGPGPRRYLSFAEGERVLWTHDPEVVTDPGASSLDVGGVEHTAIEHGRARYRSTGVTGVRPSGRVRYHDYIAGDGSRVTFEDFDGTGLWECSRGQLLDPSDVAPGAPAR